MKRGSFGNSTRIDSASRKLQLEDAGNPRLEHALRNKRHKCNRNTHRFDCIWRLWPGAAHHFQRYAALEFGFRRANRTERCRAVAALRSLLRPGS